MYPSLIWFGLLLVSVLVAYVMRRRPWYVLAWFAVLAVVGWLLPPFSLHVYCGPVGSAGASAGSVSGVGVAESAHHAVTSTTALRCVEHAVPDPYAFLAKLFSSLTFLFTTIIGFYLALKEGVLGRLW
jgi:hypothetical protein